MPREWKMTENLEKLRRTVLGSEEGIKYDGW